MHLLKTFGSAYPWRTALVLVALLLAGLVEGIGLSTMLPLLSIAADSAGQEGGGSLAQAATEQGGVGATVVDLMGSLGISPTIGSLLLVVLAGVFLKSLLVLFAHKHVGYTVARVATDLRLALVRALLATRWDYYMRQSVGSLANAVATEAYRASQAYLYGARVAALAIQSAVYVAIAFTVSWPATVISLTAGAVLLYILSYLVQMSRRAGNRQTRVLKSLLARLTDSLLAVKPLKAMAREDLVGPLLERETRRLNRALEREVFSKQALRAAQEPMFAALAGLGLYLALTRWGMPLSAVMMLAFLLARVLSHLGKLQREYQRMATCESAFWSLQAVTREAERQQEAGGQGRLAPTLTEALRLEGVGFAYDQTPVLQDLSMAIPAQAFTTLVGPSGAGKSTLLDIITGLLRPQKGEVYLDERPLNQIDLRQWRWMIGYVPQDSVLLSDTVFTNVTLGARGLDEADAERALRHAGAWAFVERLPQGMYSFVGERGAALSGGQRQRIAIARALAHRPRLLILDEATSALDAQSEADLCSTLSRLGAEITVLAISHRPALVDMADRVYQIDNGRAELVRDHDSAATGVREGLGEAGLGRAG